MDDRTSSLTRFLRVPALAALMDDPRPALVLAEDGATLLGANVAGARRFGFTALADAIGGRLALPAAITRHVAAQAGRDGPARTALVSYRAGLGTAVEPIETQGVTLADGMPALLARFAADRASARADADAVEALLGAPLHSLTRAPEMAPAPVIGTPSPVTTPVAPPSPVAAVATRDGVIDLDALAARGSGGLEADFSDASLFAFTPVANDEWSDAVIPPPAGAAAGEAPGADEAPVASETAAMAAALMEGETDAVGAAEGEVACADATLECEAEPESGVARDGDLATAAEPATGDGSAPGPAGGDDTVEAIADDGDTGDDAGDTPAGIAADVTGPGTPGPGVAIATLAGAATATGAGIGMSGTPVAATELIPSALVPQPETLATAAVEANAGDDAIATPAETGEDAAVSEDQDAVPDAPGLAASVATAGSFAALTTHEIEADTAFDDHLGDALIDAEMAEITAAQPPETEADESCGETVEPAADAAAQAGPGPVTDHLAEDGAVAVDAAGQTAAAVAAPLASTATVVARPEPEPLASRRAQPYRFVWQMNAETAITMVGPELAEAVGPSGQHLPGFRWAEVAEALGIDRDGVVAEALARKAPFSGKTVLWPVQGSDWRVPVDLAALPVFGRARQFDGYRGFGVARTADAEIHPDDDGDQPGPDGPDSPRPGGPGPGDPDPDDGGPDGGGLDGAGAGKADGDDRAGGSTVLAAGLAGVTALAGAAQAATIGTDTADGTVDAEMGAAVEAPGSVGETMTEMAASTEDVRTTDADAAELAEAGAWAFEETSPAEAEALPAGPEPDTAPVTIDIAPAEAGALAASLEEGDADTGAELAALGYETTPDAAGDAVETTDDGIGTGTGAPEAIDAPDSAKAGRDAEAESQADAADAPPAVAAALVSLPPTDADDPVDATPDGEAAIEAGAVDAAADVPADETQERATDMAPMAAEAIAAIADAVPAGRGSLIDRFDTLAAAMTPFTRETPADTAAEMTADAAATAADRAEAVEAQAADAAPESDGADDTVAPVPVEPPTADIVFVEPAPRTPSQVLSVPGAKILPVRPKADAKIVTLPSVARRAGETGGALSGTERDAFRQIAKALGARIEGDETQGPAARGTAPETDKAAPDRAGADKVPADRAGPDGAGPAAPEPSAPTALAEMTRATAPAQAGRDETQGGDSRTRAEATPRHFVPEELIAAPSEAASREAALLEQLPLAVAVIKGDEIALANRAFLDLLGYGDVAELEAAGGLDALFAGPHALKAWGGDPSLRLVPALARDGRVVPVEATLKKMGWNGGSALVLSLREPPRAAETPAMPPTSTGADGEEEADAEAQAPEALISARSRVAELEAILDTATDGVIVLGADGRIESVNRAGQALFGQDAGNMVGRPLTDFLAPESHRSALDYLDGLARNGVASVLNDGREVIGIAHGGGMVPMFMTIGRLGGGRARAFCAVLRDITHFKKAEEDLTSAKHHAEQASLHKSDFLAKMSHEIRTPLNAIIGFSEVMMEERFGPIGNARYKDYLKDIHGSGAHIMSLVNDLLDLSKIEAGKMELKFEAVSINDIVRESVALMQPQANRDRIIIRTSLPASMPRVVADERSIRQIVLNLLSNAVKFTPAGGQVIASTQVEEGGQVALRIRDTGVGMNEDEVKAALQPFRRLHTSRIKASGTGLGLPLTKALVEANRASFVIRSTVNQGTLVEIMFPTNRVLMS